jgi:adenylylsulfate kinase-like enzyme
VEAIACYDAGKKNLKVTSRRIDDLVDEAKSTGRKILCFVTGVPGAGKTLVGLNVATRHRRQEESTHAVFLSGNGPLERVMHFGVEKRLYNVKSKRHHAWDGEENS